MVSLVIVLMDIMEHIATLPMASIHVAQIRVVTVGRAVGCKVVVISVCVQQDIMALIVHTISMRVMGHLVKMEGCVHCKLMDLIHAIARVRAIMAKIVQY